MKVILNSLSLAFFRTSFLEMILFLNSSLSNTVSSGTKWLIFILGCTMGGFRSETVTLKSDCKLLFACKQTSAEGKVSIALPCLFTADAVTGIFFSLSFKFSLRAVENDFFFGYFEQIQCHFHLYQGSMFDHWTSLLFLSLGKVFLLLGVIQSIHF